MQPHGDAAQLAANAGGKVTSEQWQRNLFKRTKRETHTQTHINAHAKTTNTEHVKHDFLKRL